MELLRFLVAFALILTLQACSNTPHHKNARSSLLTLPESPISEALLRHHQQWQGTPYLLGGDNRKGIDCSAFTQNTFREQFGIEIPRTTLTQLAYGDTVAKHQLKPGDLVFFKTTANKQRHVGIYLEQQIFLHASTSQGVTLSRLDNPYWASHYWTARRIKALK